MTRTSAVVFLVFVVSGCTSDPMGLRSPYRNGNVPPNVTNQPISQPISNAPIALQPGGQLGQPVNMGQTVILPQAAISNMAAAQNMAGMQRYQNGWNTPYPMFASAGGQIDGRAFPYLNRQARLPGPGGARSQKNVAPEAAINRRAIASGLGGSPQEDLKFRGGHTIQNLKFMNLYVGGKGAWVESDVKNIDQALAAAMSDQKLNNVIMQYFRNTPVSTQFLGSSYFNGWNPSTVAKSDLEAQVLILYRQKAFDGQDLPNTVFNFMLPRGMILGDPSGGQQQTVANKAIPLADAEDSTGGLGGYHGSAHVDGKTIYYAVGVFSEKQANGKTNGIPVFDQNWKNVVATFYHELQEARTDADVDDAATGGMGVLGWTSDSGNEIGDYPIAEAQALLQVFQQIPLADSSGTVPVQFIYSNAVHGPEGPIDYPHGMEPAPGTQSPPSNPPPQKNPPQNNNPSSPVSGLPSNLPPEVANMISNWDQTQDYLKKAIVKLLQP